MRAPNHCRACSDWPDRRRRGDRFWPLQRLGTDGASARDQLGAAHDLPEFGQAPCPRCGGGAHADRRDGCDRRPPLRQRLPSLPCSTRERQTWTMRSMEPAPPHITKAVEGWEPRHLFWISLNGVKMTGMPHWPAKQRQDEVWMMTAFLARIGEVNAAGYAELTAPPAADDPLIA